MRFMWELMRQTGVTFAQIAFDLVRTMCFAMSPMLRVVGTPLRPFLGTMPIQRKQSALAVVMTLVIGCAAIVLFQQLRAPAPPLDIQRHEIVGHMLAQETARKLGGRGNILLVVPEAAFDLPLADRQVASFRETLRQQRTPVRVVGTESIRVAKPGPMTGLLTVERYRGLVAKHPGIDAIVSFVGLADIAETDLKQLTRNSPSIHVVSLDGRVPKKLFTAKLVGLAVVRREPALEVAALAFTAAPAEFTQAYLIITDDTAKKLP